MIRVPEAALEIVFRDCPNITCSWSLRGVRGGWFAAIDGLAVSQLYADDANQEEVAGYAVLNTGWLASWISRMASLSFSWGE